MLKTIKDLIRILSVSGHEEKLCEYIKEKMLPYFDTVEKDALGNLICRKKGEGRKLMFCAHMDEIGFITTFIEEDGSVRVAPIGGINFAAAAYSKVIFENGRAGVLVPEEGVSPGDYKADKFLVDIGAKTKKEAQRMVSVGDTLAVRPEAFSLASGRLSGRPLDDKIGCAVLMEAAKESASFEGDVYFVFTVQEEVGIRGSKTAAFAIRPDYGVAIDVTATGDTKGAKPMDVKLGGGAAIKIKDQSAICDTLLVEKMKESARKNDIPYQMEVLTFGGTDTASMQLSGEGCRAGCISIPTRYIHSPVECVDMKDVKASAELIVALCKEL
ncbi:MAG: M42 family metallopeptidase [Ruminococcaceae bacterium]|nr:M42 family metallopeptidase [Oscillospiraceae bacterium]